MDDPSNSDSEPPLRDLVHDLRGAIGALDHQTHLLGTRELAPELRERSIAALRANIEELRRVLQHLEHVTRAGPDRPA